MELPLLPSQHQHVPAVRPPVPVMQKSCRQKSAQLLGCGWRQQGWPSYCSAAAIITILIQHVIPCSQGRFELSLLLLNDALMPSTSPPHAVYKHTPGLWGWSQHALSAGSLKQAQSGLRLPAGGPLRFTAWRFRSTMPCLCGHC